MAEKPLWLPGACYAPFWDAGKRVDAGRILARALNFVNENLCLSQSEALGGSAKAVQGEILTGGCFAEGGGLGSCREGEMRSYWMQSK